MFGVLATKKMETTLAGGVQHRVQLPMIRVEADRARSKEGVSWLGSKAEGGRQENIFSYGYGTYATFEIFFDYLIVEEYARATPD